MAPSTLPGAALAATMLAALACTALPPGDVLPGAGPTDAHPDAGGHLTGDGVCETARPPEAPAVDDGADLEELVFASTEVTSGAEPGADGAPIFRRLGYDLDGACTDETGGDTCQPPAQANRVVDGHAGRDVNLNEVFYQTQSLLPGAATTYFTDTEGNARGESALLLRVRGYNGATDDPHVEVFVYGATLWSGEAHPMPRWDGQDRFRPTTPWLLDSEPDALDVDRPRFVDAQAHVTDGLLVARFEELRFGSAWVPAGTLHGALLTANLVRAGDGFVLRDGVIAGRWRIESFLSFFALEIDTPELTVGCRGMGLAELATELFCPLPDIHVGDDAGQGTCNAFSLMFRFQADPARVGEPLSVSALPAAECPALGCDGAPLEPPTDWPPP